MKIYGISSGNPPKTVHVIFETPYYGVTSYQLYRDGVLIADSSNEEQAELFQHPTMFDRSHGTNLFKSDIGHKLIYSDKIPNAYQQYEYQVKTEAVTPEGVVTFVAFSSLLVITGI